MKWLAGWFALTLAGAAMAQQATDTVAPEAAGTGVFAGLSPQAAAAVEAKAAGRPVEAARWMVAAANPLAVEAGAEILLAGMLIPPNYGPEYTQQFADIYPKLAEELDVALIPFLLEGVAADPTLNLADGIHPNAEGQKIVAQTVLRHLEPLLEKTAPPGDENA